MDSTYKRINKTWTLPTGCHNLRPVLTSKFSQNLSSKRVYCVFRDIRDKNAVNQGFLSKTAVFSLPATKVDCLLIFWLPHLYSLLQPEDRGPRIED